MRGTIRLEGKSSCVHTTHAFRARCIKRETCRPDDRRLVRAQVRKRVPCAFEGGAYQRTARRGSLSRE